MLYTDIPVKFRNKMKLYFKILFSTIKIKDNYLSLNGRLAPLNLKTQHQKFIIGSEQHINTLIENFYLLHIFHKFCMKHNILYSITAGNLLSYYSGRHILLWDDDIDILINDIKSYKKLIYLWYNSGQSHYLRNKWIYKNIKMDSENIILLKSTKKSIKYRNYFFKIKLNTMSNITDIGGIDIFNPFGIEQTIPHNIKNIVFNQNDENDEKYPIKFYGPVKTRILKYDFAILLLDGYYGRNWVKKIHPKLLA